MACIYVLQRASLHGVDAATVLGEMELPPDFLDNASRETLAILFPKFISTTAKLVDDELFGFAAGKCLHPCLLGASGLAATHAPNMLEALTTLFRWTNTPTSWLLIDRQRCDTYTSWTMRLADSCCPLAARHMADAWAAGVVAFGRLIVGDSFQVEKMELRREPPASQTDFESFLGDSVIFGADRDQIVVRNGLLQVESGLNDPFLYEQLLFNATALNKEAGQASMAAGVDQAIRRGSFDLTDVAAELGLNERTIQRRLSDESTTFQQRLDMIRLEMADIYLQVPTLTVEEISLRLGFSGDRAFRIAYRRWTGRAPRCIAPDEDVQ